MKTRARSARPPQPTSEATRRDSAPPSGRPANEPSRRPAAAPAGTAPPAPAPTGASPRLAQAFLLLTLFCAAPRALMALGVDLGSLSAPLADPSHQRPAAQLTEAVFAAARGSYVHTLLEWSACMVALATVVLAFAHFALKRDLVTPAIGAALFAAGIVDAFHTLAADRLIAAASPNKTFIPFTWAVSRAFNAVVPVLALCTLWLLRRRRRGAGPGHDLGFALSFSAGAGGLAWAVIAWCAASPSLPQTMFPDALVTRPWDVGPLVLYALSGGVLYPLFAKVTDNHFLQTLWLSVLPDCAAQLHMVFGSSELFDGHFNAAHFLKVTAYVLPCAGLIADYLATYRDAERARAELAARNAQLAQANVELEGFASAAAHDLRSPLRAIAHLAAWTVEDAGDGLPSAAQAHLSALRGRVARMERLLDSLLAFARAGARETPTRLDTEALVRGCIATLDVPAGFEVTLDGALPAAFGSEAALRQVFLNLVQNALRHHDRPTGCVRVGGRALDGTWAEFWVEDDGPGVPEPYRERVFEMFQTLKRRDEVEGSGLGLSLVRKRVHAAGGTITLADASPRGTRALFTWPRGPLGGAGETQEPP